MNNADDHMRLIKAVMKNSFPGINGAAARSIGGSFGFLTGDGTNAAPAYGFINEPTLGIYRASSGLLMITGGRLDGNGAVPVGSLHTFLSEPAKLGKGGVVSAAGADYLELDGGTYSTADFPRLAEHLGVTGSTFTLINFTDTGRFIRSRRSGVIAGTKESHALGSHTHTATSDAQGGHSHTFSGVTDFMDSNKEHSHGVTPGGATVGVTARTIAGGADYGAPVSNFGLGISPTNTDHKHAFSGTTASAPAHTHGITVNATGTTETRPEAVSAIICIKT